MLEFVTGKKRAIRKHGIENQYMLHGPGDSDAQDSAAAIVGQVVPPPYKRRRPSLGSCSLSLPQNNHSVELLSFGTMNCHYVYSSQILDARKNLVFRESCVKCLPSISVRSMVGPDLGQVCRNSLSSIKSDDIVEVCGNRREARFLICSSKVL
jgi:hypothetical protein